MTVPASQTCEAVDWPVSLQLHRLKRQRLATRFQLLPSDHLGLPSQFLNTTNSMNQCHTKLLFVKSITLCCVTIYLVGVDSLDALKTLETVLLGLFERGLNLLSSSLC